MNPVHKSRLAGVSRATPAKRVAVLMFAAIASLAAPLGAKAASSGAPDDIAALREQIRQLDQKIRVLERNQELKEEKAAADAKATAAASPKVSLDGKGFAVTSPDKAFSLKAGVLLQADARFFIDSTAGRDEFLLRRVRTPFSGTIFKTFNFNITPEFAQADNSTSTTNDKNTQLVDAWIDARLTSAFNLKIGKFRTPVALEGPDPRFFVENTYTNQLATNRDIGIEAFGSLADGIIAYRAGIFNGAPNNDWSATQNGNEGSFTFAGRLTVTPFRKSENALSGLVFSVGGAIGSQETTNRIRSNGQQDIVTGIATDGTHTTLAPAVEFYTGPFGAQTEFTWDRHERHGAASTVTNTGWRVNAGYVLTGEDSTARGVSPKTPFSIADGSWGAFEVVARLAGLDVDNALATANANNVEKAFSYGAGINWYLNNNIQARFDVEKTNFSGTALDNELYFFSRVQLKF
ncbi:MAG: OprO/OprP family phosphate-selective porin [Opitutaceae bacterium]|jgi:phosphate-selective porin OprO/OprP|nr:OprO/OprP family phosphate-selective porin [Opitutaceae bacterium]